MMYDFKSCLRQNTRKIVGAQVASEKPYRSNVHVSFRNSKDLTIDELPLVDIFLPLQQTI